MEPLLCIAPARRIGHVSARLQVIQTSRHGHSRIQQQTHSSIKNSQCLFEWLHSVRRTEYYCLFWLILGPLPLPLFFMIQAGLQYFCVVQ